MVNTREKGRRNEKRAADKLEAEGWLVYRVKGATLFNKNVDIFGLFDIFAIARDGETKLIQVKTNRKPTLDIYKKFKKDYCHSILQRVEVWVWKDYKGFKVYEV